MNPQFYQDQIVPQLVLGYNFNNSVFLDIQTTNNNNFRQPTQPRARNNNNNSTRDNNTGQRTRRAPTCGLCGQSGHTRRSCQQR